jgi:hypothetical protein
MVVDFHLSSITATEISGFMRKENLSGRSDNGNDQGMIIRDIVILTPYPSCRNSQVADETAVWHRRGVRDSV